MRSNTALVQHSQETNSEAFRIQMNKMQHWLSSDPQTRPLFHHLQQLLQPAATSKFMQEMIRCSINRLEIQNKNNFFRLGLIFSYYKVDQASQCFRKAIEINPQNAQAYQNLVRKSFNISQPEARECYRLIVNNRIRNQELESIRIQELTKSVELECYRTIVKIQPKNPYYNFLLAKSLSNIDKMEAIEYFKQAAELNYEKKTQTYWRLALLLISINKLQEAKYWLKQQIEMHSDSETMDHDAFYFYRWVTLVNLLYGMNKQEVVNCYKSVIENYQTNSNAFVKLGLLLQSLKRFQEATGYYQKAVVVNPQNSRAYLILGQSLQKMNKTEAGMECYKKAIKINPKQFSAYQNLAKLLKMRGNYQQAIKYLQKILKLNIFFKQGIQQQLDYLKNIK